MEGSILVLRSHHLTACGQESAQNHNWSANVTHHAAYSSKFSDPMIYAAVMRPPKRTMAMAISSMMKNMDRADQL